MKYYELRENKSEVTEIERVKFSKNFDLIVVGLGSAGAYCAVAAAREGLNVLGVERAPDCGGMSVRGWVTSYYSGIEGGIYEETDEGLSENKGICSHFTRHPDLKSVALGQLLVDSGVKAEYCSVVLGVFVDENRVCGIRLFSNHKITNIACRFLSDSTSDGHILRMLPVQFSFGRRSDGTTAPFSILQINRRPDGTLGSEMPDSGYINQYNDREFSRSVIGGCAEFSSSAGYAKKRPLMIGSLAGIREGLLFEGEQKMTLADALNERDFGNTLFCAFSDFDMHGEDHAFCDDEYVKWHVLCNLGTVALKIRVPVGCIIPKGLLGIVSVSRCLSVDSYVSSAVRMNLDMYRLGEAAGYAIASAVRKNLKSLLDVNPDEFKLRKCFDSCPDRLRAFEFYDEPILREFEWLTDIEKIKEGLSGDCPGKALRSCERLGAATIAAWLTEWMAQKDKTALRHNSAIALGLLGEKNSLPVLREMVINRTDDFLHDCRRSNQMRSVMAICLCGRLGDTEIVPELLSILDDKEYGKPFYHTHMVKSYEFSTVEEMNVVYYQFLSFTLAALRLIISQNPQLKNEVSGTVSLSFKNGKHIDRIAVSKARAYMEAAEGLKAYVEQHFSGE